MSHRTAGIRTVGIRTLVSFALLTPSHCWHSHCWLRIRTGVVCTSVFRTLKCRTSYYRKRRSASYIVREVREVRERETEREREMQRDRERERETEVTTVTLVALKLAISLHLLAKSWHRSFLPCHLSFLPFQMVYGHLCGAEICNEFTLSLAKKKSDFDYLTLSLDKKLAHFVSPLPPFVSPFLHSHQCGAEIRNEFTLSVAKKKKRFGLLLLVLVSTFSNGATNDRRPKTNHRIIMPAPSKIVLPIEK